MTSRLVILVAALAMAVTGLGSEQEMPSGIPTMTPEELANYQFDTRSREPPVVQELSLGQRFVLTSQRREIKDLIARRLGVLELKGDKRDLKYIQALADQNILRDDILAWQKVGVTFGDILVGEFDLDWVSYEDERGKSKALQWRGTMNFVFPITVFSRRVEARQKIDVQAIYNKIAEEVESFTESDRARGRTGR